MDRNIDNKVDNNIIQTEYSELMQKYSKSPAGCARWA